MGVAEVLPGGEEDVLIVPARGRKGGIAGIALVVVGRPADDPASTSSLSGELGRLTFAGRLPDGVGGCRLFLPLSGGVEDIEGE